MAFGWNDADSAGRTSTKRSTESRTGWKSMDYVLAFGPLVLHLNAKIMPYAKYGIELRRKVTPNTLDSMTCMSMDAIHDTVSGPVRSFAADLPPGSDRIGELLEHLYRSVPVNAGVCYAHASLQRR